MKFQDPGVIVLFGPSGGGGTEDATADFDDDEEGESEEGSTDSECDVNRPVSPCNFTFIGANAGAGKSSLRGGQLKRKKVGFWTRDVGIGLGMLCHSVARWQNLIPSSPWIAPGPGWRCNPRKGRVQILQHSIAEP